jgi:hypothetical protein
MDHKQSRMNPQWYTEADGLRQMLVTRRDCACNTIRPNPSVLVLRRLVIVVPFSIDITLKRNNKGSVNTRVTYLASTATASITSGFCIPNCLDKAARPRHVSWA